MKRQAVKAFKGFKHEVTATGTIVEIDDFDDLCKLLKRIKENLEKVKVPRIYFSIKVDYKKAKDTIERRVRSIMNDLRK